MLKIYGDREHFYQWDLNQKLVVADPSVKEVHFANCFMDEALVVEVKDGLVEVPNILLQENLDIRAYGYCGDCHTLFEKTFKVNYKTKPADYVYTETEIKTYAALDERIKALDERVETLEGKEVKLTWEAIEGKPAINAGTGENSIVEGLDTEATGRYTHAEGVRAIAKGHNSHAEGIDTLAQGSCSHAEGNGAHAVGSTSHAEGEATRANGNDSHAEGYRAQADGIAAHAQNERTVAYGRGSHAEGYYTYAYGDYQHAQGKYNAIDYSNTYAHIVGNGTSEGARKNAHTLDWNGNAWFAGDVSVGSGKKKLATQNYVDEAMANVVEDVLAALPAAEGVEV